MTAIAIAKGASTKSCVLSQERFDAIDRPPSIVPTRQADLHVQHAIISHLEDIIFSLRWIYVQYNVD